MSSVWNAFTSRGLSVLAKSRNEKMDYSLSIKGILFLEFMIRTRILSIDAILSSYLTSRAYIRTNDCYACVE